MPVGDPDTASIGELFGQLGEDTRRVVSAEIDVVRQTALSRLAAAKVGLVLIVVALLLVLAALPTLLIGVSLSLAHWLGFFWASLLVVVVALAIAGLCAKLAATRLSAAFAGEAGK